VLSCKRLDRVDTIAVSSSRSQAEPEFAMGVQIASRGTQKRTRPGRTHRRASVALLGAVLAFISIPLGVLPISWAIYVIGVILTLGTGP
jgi:hypothetical protein